MTTSTPKAPTDVCEICGTQRDEHGDKHHRFSEEGEFVPMEAGAKPRQEAPKERGSAPRPVGTEHVAALHLRLIEVLVEKGILDGEDLHKLFGGQ